MTLTKHQRANTTHDLYIAKKLRERRLALGLSQQRLAQLLGVSANQLHKYEKNIDRVPASRLLELRHFLQVPLNFFYEDREDFSPQGKEVQMICVKEKEKITIRLLVEEGTLMDVKAL
ncbi:helix-turn-helix domain-containing protein [Candidatus Odyssella acanthamoebae]|uniref:helix-turn-helix domain-containing protein n=1 Tax=Candidatus Odyssella acanthamoebae TaxID=91604 RepID=UPI00068C3CA8|nr:helix-turn-helix transcriptional regulator [Candidatus Paracaedibacter acanthamoebae]